jgi:hypothetical protein
MKRKSVNQRNMHTISEVDAVRRASPGATPQRGKAALLYSIAMAGVVLCAPSGGAACIIIRDVIVNVDGVPTDIGDIDVCVPGTGYTMDATFTVDPNWKNLCNSTEFHWFQIIVHDDCPLEYPVAGTLTPIPIADWPSGGYVQSPPGEGDARPWYDGEGIVDCNTFTTQDTKTPCRTCVGGGPPRSSMQ